MISSLWMVSHVDFFPPLCFPHRDSDESRVQGTYNHCFGYCCQNLTSNERAAKAQPYPFADLKGKVVLVVNVASKCGFTPQYDGLEKVYQKYKDKDFVILGFPSNQFGGQEPGSDEEIGSFCKLK
jgi:Glutathione peroxidase